MDWLVSLSRCVCCPGAVLLLQTAQTWSRQISISLILHEWNVLRLFLFLLPLKKGISLLVQHLRNPLGPFWRHCRVSPLSQVGDFILHGGGDLLQPIAELHLLGRGVLLQRRDDLKRDGTTLDYWTTDCKCGNLHPALLDLTMQWHDITWS